jgi:hypothetical protein
MLNGTTSAQTAGSSSSPPRDPTDVRRAFGFASAANLRARVATIMTTGRYVVPEWDTRKKSAVAAQQTDRLYVRDVGVCDGIADFEEEQRHLDLKIGMPTPGTFPVLTVSQLLDAEKRVLELITRLELEIGRCHDEERTKKISMNTLSTNGMYVSTAEWTHHMRERVTDRLRARGQDEAEVAFYSHKLLQASSPQRRQLVTASPRREASLAIARAPPLLETSLTVSSKQDLHMEQQRAVEDALIKAQARRKTSFAGSPAPNFQRVRQ